MNQVKSIKQVIGEAIGEASMCWLPLPSSQVFDSSRASDIVDRLASFYVSARNPVNQSSEGKPDLRPGLKLAIALIEEEASTLVGVKHAFRDHEVLFIARDLVRQALEELEIPIKKIEVPSLTEHEHIWRPINDLEAACVVTGCGEVGKQ